MCMLLSHPGRIIANRKSSREFGVARYGIFKRLSLKQYSDKVCVVIYLYVLHWIAGSIIIS